MLGLIIIALLVGLLSSIRVNFLVVAPRLSGFIFFALEKKCY